MFLRVSKARAVRRCRWHMLEPGLERRDAQLFLRKHRLDRTEAVLAGLNGEAVQELLALKISQIAIFSTRFIFSPQRARAVCFVLFSFLFLDLSWLNWLLRVSFSKFFMWEFHETTRCAYVESKVTELPYFASKAWICSVCFAGSMSTY